MLMVLPILTFSDNDSAPEYGLREIFWFGRSNCASIQGNFKCDEGPWLTSKGWDELLRQYVVASRGVETDELTSNLLWLYVPNFNESGKMSSINYIPNRNYSSNFWTEEPNCAGFTVSD
jgi:hypothetical protein